MSVKINNNAATRLASSLTSGAGSLSVTSGEGSKFPSPAVGEWFPVTVLKSSGQLEIMRCTARTGDVLTVSRGQEGTSALAFDAGDRVELRLTAAVVAELQSDTAAKQPGDALLTAIAALVTGNGKFMAFTGVDAAAVRDLVGTVSQSGGIPTGALVEFGSNANGKYWRFLGGLQICLSQDAISVPVTTAAGSVFSAGTGVTWNFPAAFAEIPFVDSVPGTNTTTWGGGNPASTTSSASIRLFAAGSVTTTGTAVAIGRWHT